MRRCGPPGKGLAYTYLADLAAILVTLIAVVATLILIRLQRVKLIPKNRLRKTPEGSGKGREKGIRGRAPKRAYQAPVV